MLRVAAKVDYALRALVALARVAPASMKGEQIAREQTIPFRFLEVTLSELRHAGLVVSRRGSDGGYRLARAPEEITVRDLVVAVEGSVSDIRLAPVGGENGTRDGGEIGLLAALDVRRATEGVWVEAVACLDDLLGRTNLAELVQRADRADAPDAQSR